MGRERDVVHLGRFAGVMVVFVALGAGVVHLRAEARRCEARMLRSEQERIALRTEFWRLQMAVARLKTPQRIRSRLEQLASGGVQLVRVDGWGEGRD